MTTLRLIMKLLKSLSTLEYDEPGQRNETIQKINTFRPVICHANRLNVYENSSNISNENYTEIMNKRLLQADSRHKNVLNCHLNTSSRDISTGYWRERHKFSDGISIHGYNSMLFLRSIHFFRIYCAPGCDKILNINDRKQIGKGRKKRKMVKIILTSNQLCVPCTLNTILNAHKARRSALRCKNSLILNYKFRCWLERTQDR